jgi:hypothetical protein
MSFIKICSLVLKASPFLQGHLSATLLAIKFHASKHFKPAATGMFHGLMQMMDSVDEYY